MKKLKLIAVCLVLMLSITACNNGTKTPPTGTTADISNIESTLYEDKDLGIKVNYPALFEPATSEINNEVIFGDPDNENAYLLIAHDDNEFGSVDDVIEAYGIVEEHIVSKDESSFFIDGRAYEEQPYYTKCIITDDYVIWATIMYDNENAAKYHDLCEVLTLEVNK